MTLLHKGPFAGSSTDHSNSMDKSGLANSEESGEHVHHKRLAKLELSDGQHIYSKLVVIINAFSNNSLHFFLLLFFIHYLA